MIDYCKIDQANSSSNTIFQYSYRKFHRLLPKVGFFLGIFVVICRRNSYQAQNKIQVFFSSFRGHELLGSSQHISHLQVNKVPCILHIFYHYRHHRGYSAKPRKLRIFHNSQAQAENQDKEVLRISFCKLLQEAHNRNCTQDN